MASSQTGGPASRGRAAWAQPPGPRHLRSCCNFPAAQPVGRLRPGAWGSGRSALRAPSDRGHSRAARAGAGAGAAAESRDPTARAAIRVARGLLRKRGARVSRFALRAVGGKSPEVSPPVPRRPIPLRFTPGPRVLAIGRGGRGPGSLVRGRGAKSRDKGSAPLWSLDARAEAAVCRAFTVIVLSYRSLSPVHFCGWCERFCDLRRERGDGNIVAVRVISGRTGSFLELLRRF